MTNILNEFDTDFLFIMRMVKCLQMWQFNEDKTIISYTVHSYMRYNYESITDIFFIISMNQFAINYKPTTLGHMHIITTEPH